MVLTRRTQTKSVSFLLLLSIYSHRFTAKGYLFAIISHKEDADSNSCGLNIFIATFYMYMHAMGLGQKFFQH